jgi:hypothetical protein
MQALPESKLEPKDGSAGQAQEHSYARFRVGYIIPWQIYTVSRRVGRSYGDCGSRLLGEDNFEQLYQTLGFICTMHCSSGGHAYLGETLGQLRIGGAEMQLRIFRTTTYFRR